MFFYDILIVGSTDAEHDARVRQVLQRLKQRGVQLKKDKCEFGQSKVTYLGHRVDHEGLKPTEDKVKAIREAPELRNVTELKAFLGLLNYYSHFLPNLSNTLQALYELLQKGKQWRWTRKHRAAFNAAKNKLLQSGFLTHYNLSRPVELKCDTSPYGIGACLSHEFEDGSERPVAFASRTLSSAEKGYAQIEREALAIIFGVRHFHKFLIGRRFTLVTDHKPLVKILGPKQGIPAVAAARLQRWALILSAYEYTLEYMAGEENKEADMLSRLPMEVNAVDPNQELYHVDCCENLPLTAAEVAQETKANPILRRAYQYTLSGWNWKSHMDPRLQPYSRRSDELSVEENCLLWGTRVIIPQRLQSRVLADLHENHLGSNRMKALARSYIWWPSLDMTLEELCKKCEVCQSQRNKPPAGIPHPWMYPTAPWERVHTDFAELEGQHYLIMINAYSKWLEVHEMGTSTTASRTIEVMRRVFTFHGIPRQLVTDNGPQFRSVEFQEFMKGNGVKHQLTPPYHPSSNGQAERAVQIFKRSMEARPKGRTIQHQISILLLQ